MKKTLKKVLDELGKDKPDISYVRGMLEVLIGEDDIPEYSAVITQDRNGNPITPVKVHSPTDKELVIDEATVLNNIATANLDKVKKMNLDA